MHSVYNKALKIYCKKRGKEFHFHCPEYKMLCLGQIQYNTSLITTLHIFEHYAATTMLENMESGTQ